MSKQIYEEALADARQIRQIAEDHAKRAILDEVTPRIREQIDQFMLGTAADDAQVEQERLTESTDEDDHDTPLTTLQHGRSGDATGNMFAMQDTPTVMNADGSQPTYELDLESVEKLMPVLRATNEAVEKELELSVYKVGDRVASLRRMAARKKGPRSLDSKIAETITKIDNMYEYVKKNEVSSGTRGLLECRLESYFKELQQIRENNMSKNRLEETDVNFKVTGVPDEAAAALSDALSDQEGAEDIGIDIQVGDEDVAPPAEELTAEPSSDEGGDLEAPADDLDVGGFGGGDDGVTGDEDEDDMQEGTRLSDDTIVEVDEKMLQRELKRLRELRESKNWPSEILSDFGGGKSEGDPWLDGEVTTEGEKVEEEGDLGTAPPKPPTVESLRRRVQFEKRNIARISERMTAIKEAAKKNGKSGSVSKLREAWNNANERLAGSRARLDKYTKLLQTEVKRSQAQQATPNGEPRKPAESAIVNELRTQLAEQNLHNAKLSYTNKLLQADGLTSKQKAQIIKSLDEAKSLREVKLLYDNLARAFGQPQQPQRVDEGSQRKVIGSGSRPTKSGSPQQLNEDAGAAVDRWARLAGIK